LKHGLYSVPLRPVVFDLRFSFCPDAPDGFRSGVLYLTSIRRILSGEFFAKAVRIL